MLLLLLAVRLRRDWCSTKQILKNLYNNLQFIYVYFSINLYADLKKECVQHILFKKVKIIYKIAIKGKYKGT